MAGGPTRKDTWEVRLAIDGVNFGGSASGNGTIWDVKTGGAVTTESVGSYKEGGMRGAVSLGGDSKTENIVLNRMYRKERDHLHLQKLIDAVGIAECMVAQQPMQINKEFYGNAIVSKGKLVRVTPPDADSNSQDAAIIEVEIEIDGLPSVGESA